MNKLLTPEKILDNVINNNMSYNEAIELLISIIEVSESEDIRARCIDVLSNLDVKSKKIFKTLENYLLSDETSLVRAAAAKALVSKFPKGSLVPLRYTIRYDKSAIVLKTLAYSLENADNQNFEILKEELTANFERIAMICGIFPKELLLLLDLEFDIDFFNKSRSSSVFGVRYGISKSFAVRDNHVRALYLRGLSVLPESIGSFKYLEHLDLCNNNISKIPESIGSLTSLKALWLSNNNIENIPDSIGSLISLVSLKLNNNKIQKIPTAIKNLTNLKYLDLKNNEIREIPDILESLKFLEQLDIRYNRIEKFPESIGSLASLEELWLSNNKLQKIFEGLKNLENLKYLDLGNNDIRNISESIEDLKKGNIKILY
jgi:Leucine-rich repeat (LRR) protein